MKIHLRELGTSRGHRIERRRRETDRDLDPSPETEGEGPAPDTPTGPRGAGQTRGMRDPGPEARAPGVKCPVLNVKDPTLEINLETFVRLTAD